METFEVLPHTADVGIIAYGTNLKEVYENAARGMFSLITDLEAINIDRQDVIEVVSSSQAELLVDWLNELIYHFEVDQALFRDFKIVEWDEETHLKAIAKGESLDLARHPVKIQIKACTYFGLEVKKDQHYQAKVYFDV